MLVERIAAEAGMTLLVLTPGAILSKWSGESEKQLRAVFDVARALQPCIVFMDEVDSLAPTRGCGDDPIGRRLLNELLVQMSCLASGVVGPRSAVAGPPTPLTNAVDAMGNRYSGNGSGGDGSCDSMSVYVFAATNRIQDCDPALLRRFDRRVAVPLPDVKARETFLAGVLARPEVGDHSLDASELRQLAERTEGYSGSDLAQLCREAVMQPVRELLREMADWGPWGRGSSISTAAAVAPSVAFSGGGDVPGGPRSLGIQDFEWALGVVQPVQPPTS
ncbi:hypothetical protein Vretimale_3829 [Volvox reticuliferus]|nr:hypothetical protein Vretimale_3829 [Volvox reticuliferus]